MSPAARKRVHDAGWASVRSFVDGLRAEGPSLFGPAGGGEGAAGSPLSGAGGSAALGLSLVHRLPEEDAQPGTFRVEIAEGGSAVRVREVREKRGRKARLVLGKRGRIRGMSKAASRRALFQLQSVDQSRVVKVFFLTFTAGPEVLAVDDWPKVERSRRLWEKAFERRFGSDAAACFWKKEPHSSDGRPHLHRLLIWVKPPPSWDEFIAWNDQAWADAVGASRERALCQTEVMKSWNGAAFYLRKYIGKPLENDEFGGALTGKCWDIRWRRNLPVKRTEKVVAAAVGRKVLRSLRQLQSRKRERWYFRPGPRYGWRPQWSVKSLGISTDQAPLEFSSDGDYRRFCAVEFGWEFKRHRPSCMSRRVERTWAVDEETRKLEPMGEEVVTRAFSMHFLASSQAQKLLDFWERSVKRDSLAHLTSCERRWLAPPPQAAPGWVDDVAPF